MNGIITTRYGAAFPGICEANEELTAVLPYAPDPPIHHEIAF